METVRGEIPGRLFCVYPRKYVKIYPLFPLNLFYFAILIAEFWKVCCFFIPFK